MASNLHKDLTDLQLHVPKGFAGASNGTTCQKDATGNLVWAVAGGGGGGKEIDIQSMRGVHQNKTGFSTNWAGYDDNYYPQMSIDFLQQTTANVDIIWGDIIPAVVYNVTSANPTLVAFEGALIANASITVDLSLWYVQPLCAGASKGTIKHISTKTVTTSSNMYECFSLVLSQSLVKGAMILPLIKTSGNAIVKFTGTIRLEQL
tara:strand:+ start:681 stop:1295 length:615 start_codon:yes stop_codon:yes gene_type:complete